MSSVAALRKEHTECGDTQCGARWAQRGRHRAHWSGKETVILKANTRAQSLARVAGAAAQISRGLRQGFSSPRTRRWMFSRCRQ